jgi:oligosaccharyltransferase complex subunit alpha (ribophorin I)
MHSKLHELNQSLIQNFLARPECPRNWPTAHTLRSSNKDWLYRNFTRGTSYGWYCTFTIEYGLPLEDFLFQSEDGRRYINLTFGVPLLDTVVNDFTTLVSVASSYLINHLKDHVEECHP